MFGDLKSSNEIKEQGDVLGGGSVSESDLYEAEIKVAYGITSSGGAKGMVIEFKLPSNRSHRETVYVTSGTAKGCKNYYEKDGEKHYLPGFSMMNAIAMLTLEKELSALKFEDKTLKIYDATAKAETPQQVPVAVELTGKKIKIGLLKVRKNKQVKTDTGYVDTNEERFVNELDRVFHYPSNVTLAEARAKQTATFHEQWLSKWKGQVKDTFKEVEGGASAGRPTATGGGAGEKPSSLFG